MSFRIAMTGISAATDGLRTTANNIANANTTGFRPSRAEFTELSVAGAQAGNAVGSGVRTAQIAQLTTPGKPESSNVDLAEQLLNMIEFSLQLKAQARVIETASENAAAVNDLFDNRDSN